MGRPPEAWIAPAELREFTRHRQRLVGPRTSYKDQVDAVLAKLGIPVTCPGIFGTAGDQSGKQGLRVAVADGGLVVSGQAVIGVQGGGKGRRDAVVIRGVGPEQDVAGAGERLEGGQGGTRGQRRVEVEARERSEAARRLAVRLQDISGVGMSYAFAVWLAVIRGDPAELPPDVFDFIAAAPPIPVVKAGLATALFVAGRTDEAQAVYQTLRQLPASGDSDIRTFGALTQMMDLIIAFRDAEMAETAYRLLHPHVTDSGASGTGLVWLSGSLHWPLGRLAALLGRTEQALDHFARAATVNVRLGARPFVALTRLDWAETLKRSGDDQARARMLAREAAAEARRLDMPGPADRAERLARELHQAAQTANPLTRRDREIAQLISSGLTNRAIADRLVLSERTVEGHVRSALAKLQLTNRTELAAWALQAIQDLRGPPGPPHGPDGTGRHRQQR